MNALLAVVLVVAVTLHCEALGTLQSYAVKGVLRCDGKPAAGVKLRLYDVDTLSIDDKLDEGVSDDEGEFRLEGSTKEVGNIDPKLNIYHHCGDTGGILQKCTKKVEIVLDKKYITKESEKAAQTFDAGEINLNANQKRSDADFEELSPTFLSLNIRDEKAAKDFVDRLYPNERKMIFDIIQRRRANQYKTAEQQNKEKLKEVHHEELVGIWWMTYTPYFLYGFIDNTAMIVAGESFDLTVGQAMGVSVMAGAACGNIVSNLIGIYLIHYVEMGVAQVVVSPNLQPGQENLWPVRFVKNLARLTGIFSGCILGMFPLLFYTNERQDDIDNDQSLERNENEFRHDWLSEVCLALNQPVIYDGMQHDFDVTSATAEEATEIGEGTPEGDDPRFYEKIILNEKEGGATPSKLEY
ncbi:unnamed protein product [Bursaphelenchus okinawaensis]|uniref:Uncharacterized protein n=1 Tax=Bursaphelenchus okinawaensis TaxID=465554 RepID=A0A811K939_9BILA|nr:unnamed protein product [Bursaphelenchus okinawaensis]CAG9094580.1 unnamed protein product [Bursaphelenchus okinawaensis]